MSFLGKEKWFLSCFDIFALAEHITIGVNMVTLIGTVIWLYRYEDLRDETFPKIK